MNRGGWRTEERKSEGYDRSAVSVDSGKAAFTAGGNGGIPV